MPPRTTSRRSSASVSASASTSASTSTSAGDRGAAASPRQADAASSIVCYDGARLGARLDEYLTRWVGCKLGGGGSIHAPTAMRPSLRSTHPNVSSVFEVALRKRNARHGGTSSPLLPSADRQQRDSAVCHGIRALYARDAALWDAHCGGSSTSAL